MIFYYNLLRDRLTTHVLNLMIQWLAQDLIVKNIAMI